MKHKVLIFISALVVVAVAGTSFVLTRPQTIALELKPKIGNCYLLSEKEFEAPSPLTNPLLCAELHNAETYWVAKWPLELAPSRYSDDLINDVAVTEPVASPKQLTSVLDKTNPKPAAG